MSGLACSQFLRNKNCITVTVHWARDTHSNETPFQSPGLDQAKVERVSALLSLWFRLWREYASKSPFFHQKSNIFYPKIYRLTSVAPSKTQRWTRWSRDRPKQKSSWRTTPKTITLTPKTFSHSPSILVMFALPCVWHASFLIVTRLILVCEMIHCYHFTLLVLPRAPMSQSDA